MKTYTATHYRVTDIDITRTGTTEDYPAETRAEAIEHALYTHRLHNGRAATIGKHDIIHCPSCGQILMSYKPNN